jgi:hypothetical protein
MDLYSSLPHKAYSLGDFVRKAEGLASDEGADQIVFDRFLLTGEFKDEHQAVVDPIRNIVPDDHDVKGLRDYDSVVSFTTEIVVDSTISIYPIPNPAEVLSTSVHIQYPITRGDVRRIILTLNKLC